MSVDTKIAELPESVEAETVQLTDVKYNSKYSPHLLTVLLVGQCYELATSILTLTKSNSDVGISVLLRSLVECTFRLAYIAKDPSINCLSLELKDNQERLKALQRMQSEPNTQQILKDRIDWLRAQSATNHDFAAMLKITGHSAWYPIFSMLSNMSHGQIAGIAFQSLTPENTYNKVELLKPMDAEYQEGLIAMSIQLLNEAVHLAINISKSHESN